MTTPNGETDPVDGAKESRRIGSLCTGILGLDRAVAEHFDADLAWYSEVEQSAIGVIEREHPGVPNLGDLKQIDWADVPPVDVLTAGYPCQPFSHAGKRKGKDDPRHLWPFIIEGVRQLRPHYVVLENVRGHLSLGFDAVLGSLAEAGFDAEWCVLRASDVGAPHQRARVFIVAWDADRAPADAHAEASASRDRSGEPDRRTDRVALLPTPVVNDMGANKTPEQWDAWREAMKAKHGNGNGHGPSLSIEAQRLALLPTPTASASTGAGTSGREGGMNLQTAVKTLPTPTVGDSRNTRNATAGRNEGSKRGHTGTTLSDVAWLGSWGKYEAAIRRWESITRTAPAPVDGDGRLSPRFVEWMQGYPEGWVDGLNRTAALKALGNAVVTPQALAALRELCPQVDVIGAAA